MKKVLFLYIALILLMACSSLVSSLDVKTVKAPEPPMIKTSGPPKEPILCIETGMHTAAIKKIGIDAENRYLVTGSHDKTVRVWDLSTGMLIRTIRPPIGEGDEGKIYAVAISPDGKIIACGGWTGWDWEKAASIYLFDRESGRLIKRISGLPDVINHLAYSKDSRFLVAGVSKGIQIYLIERDSSQTSVKLVLNDRDYSDISSRADFDGKGRLVTTSFDGFIRLYEKDFRLIKKEKAPGGNRPFSLSFSPDGEKIAIGYIDSTRIDVLSGRDLLHLYSPDTKGVTNGSLSAVSWSSDGRSLYAGGGWMHREIGFPIRKWTEGGKGTYTDLPGADGNILHILPLRGGGIAYGAAAPCFGVIDQKDIRTLYKTSSIADYRGNLEGFLISYDGSTIQFGYELWGKSPARYSITSRLLDAELRALQSETLLPPVTSSEGLNITEWKNTYNPKLNGIPLKLEEYERSRSLSISPDRKTFLLGSEWLLRLFDRNGQEKWKIPAPSVSWGVNISGNGKLAVAAFADGTIRWYRMENGKELLAFFPHNDKKRWIIWTPKGYYDASPGAEEIIGWHLNNGMDNAADFFPISRFRPIYYRPDVIAKIIDTIDEDKALQLANEESSRVKQEVSIERSLPPVVRIFSPLDDSEVSTTEISVKFTIRTPSGEPVTNVKALVDGRPVAAERGLKIVGKDETTREIKVSIPGKDSEISILAENRYGVSEPATVRVKWRGKERKEEFIIQPKLYVLAIGVSKYEDKNLTLKFAAKDALDFGKTMKMQKDGFYREVVVKILTDEKGTRDEIMDGLDWIQRETTSKDIAMIFLAGHGVNDVGGIYYYLPVNVDTERLKRTGVAFSDIKNTISSLAGKTILFVDTCHSGNVMGARRGVADMTAVVNELASAETGAVVFASSTGKQYSIEDPSFGNGAFTKALVEGLMGKADYTGKGRITINMLDLYISERVKELTNGRQTPVTAKPHTIPDFPIAVKKIEDQRKIEEERRQLEKQEKLQKTGGVDLYKEAYETFSTGNLEEARKKFETFLKRYPSTELSDNAQFWIGETYYMKKDFEKAILAYEKVIVKYPEGDKIPAALFKQALAFLELGDKLNGRNLLRRLIERFPGSDQAELAKKRLLDLR